jgi:hypothetical protein
MQSLSRMKITKEHGPMKCSKQTMVWSHDIWVFLMCQPCWN